MSDPTGKLQAVKGRLNDYVDAAIGGIVSNDWRISIHHIGTFPVSTIRLPSFDLIDENYGKRTPEVGCWAFYDFSVFIHEERDDSYGVSTPDNYQTLDAADDLLDYLIGIRGNATEKSTYGIYNIFNLRIVEENPRGGPRDIATVSVRGRIRAKWE